MKRFVIATASALFLIAGTATASVPSGPASRSAHQNPLLRSPRRRPGLETIAPVGLAPLLPGVDPAILADPDLAIPGLPGGVTQLFGAVDPALAALAGVVPGPVAGLLPARDRSAPVARRPAGPAGARTRGDTGAGAAGRRRRLRRRSAGRPRPTACRRGPSRPPRPRTSSRVCRPTGTPPTARPASSTPTLLQVGEQRLENLDAAFSGATFSSAPDSRGQERDGPDRGSRPSPPATPSGGAAVSRSGLAIGQSDPNQIIPGSVAEAKAPPSTRLVTKEVGPGQRAAARQRQPPSGPGAEQGQLRLHDRHRPVLRARLRRQPRR